MKVVATRRIWRPLRCFVILVCAGGALLAADNSWKTSLPFIGENQFVDWFAALTETGSREANVVLPAEPERSPDVQSALSRWTERSIFYQPSNGWTLDAARSAGLPLSKTQSNSGSMSFAQSITGPYSSTSFSSDLVRSSGTSSSVPPASPSGVDGTWTSGVSGNWSAPGNWSGGTVADGAGNSAHFETLDISTDVAVNLDTSRTIGNLYVGDTNGTNRYSIAPVSGSTLTFDDNSSDFSVHSILQQTSTSAGDTIAADILVKNDLEINNLSATRVFTISGNVASSATNFSSQTLRFNNTANAAGDIVMSGNLSNGSANGQLNLVVLAGTVTLTGTNTYTGYTEIEGGTLLINGNNSGVSNNVYVDGGGTLGGQGTIGKTVYAFGGTITGATATTVGTLTLLSDVVLHTGETEGGTYLANLSGSTSDLLAITGNLILGSDTTLDIVGTADGLTTYVLATFAGHTGQFGSTTGVPAGYTLVYNAGDIELVPTAIPEPATWMGGALALGGLVFARRKRKR